MAYTSDLLPQDLDRATAFTGEDVVVIQRQGVTYAEAIRASDFYDATKPVRGAVIDFDGSSNIVQITFDTPMVSNQYVAICSVLRFVFYRAVLYC